MFSFLKPSPHKMRDQQLQAAQCSLVQHKQAAAYHQAMSTYLAGEVSRLGAEVAAENEAVPKTVWRPAVTKPMAV